jgi:hypothetical protein
MHSPQFKTYSQETEFPNTKRDSRTTIAYPTVRFWQNSCSRMADVNVVKKRKAPDMRKIDLLPNCRENKTYTST